VPLGRNHARPRCTVALGPRPRRRLGPRARPRGRGLRSLASARDGAARRTPERSPLPRARRGAAGVDATAAETEQTAAVEHPRGEEIRLSGGVSPTRWGYSGRRWSCDGEEGGEGEINAPRTKNGEGRARATLTVFVLTTAEVAGQRRRLGRARTAGHGVFGQRRADTAGRGSGGAREAGRYREASGRGEALSGRRRRGRGELSRRATSYPNNGFKPRHWRSTWQPRGNGALPRGPGAARGV
jgi:hypothetical protein